MQFEKGHLYRNKHMLDLDMYVIYVIKSHDGGSDLLVRYITKKTGALVGDNEHVTVLNDQYKNWSKIS